MDVQSTGAGDIVGSFYAEPRVFPVNDMENELSPGGGYNLEPSTNPDSANVDNPTELRFVPRQGNPADGTYHKIEWTIGGHTAPVYVAIKLGRIEVNELEQALATWVTIDVDDVTISIND